MGLETRKRVAKLYREGKWRQDDMVAKAWADEHFPEKKEDKKETSKKAKE